MIERALESIYLPNDFIVSLIGDLIGRAEKYNSDLFASEANHTNKVYYPPVAEVYPLCLTGLAGVGKSKVINALIKMMPLPQKLTTLHGENKISSFWYTSGRGRPGPRQLLVDLLQSDDVSGRENVRSLLVECARRANRDGVSLIILDETQHFNTGEGLARVTDILLNLSVLGPPIIFATNYSLLHRLKTRNSEDRHRLLRDVRIMLPDPPGSDSWNEYVEEVLRVGAEVFELSNAQISKELYRLTFGVKRLVVLLMKCAYLEARKSGRGKVHVDDIRRAYTSVSYSSSRVEVELLHRAAIGGQSCLKPDLRCPFDLPESYLADVGKLSREDRDAKVWQRTIQSSLSKEEKQVLAEIQPSVKVSKGSQNASKQKGAAKPSLEDLEAAHFSLLESLSLRP